MNAGLKPYPAYRDSGLPWLGAIPSHWETRRNGRLFAQRNQTGFPDLPILEVSLKTGVRVRDFGGAARKQVMAEREKYKRAAAGDLAYNMMRMWQGAVGVAPVDGLVSPAYVVARAYEGTDTGYYSHLFRTAAYKAEVDNYSHGIVKDRNRLYWDDFKQMPSLFPPPDEQAAIVRFLAHTDRLIRRYVRAKQKLVKLLGEQKQAIVHRAVTRGLDPNVRLKPSGVEWLGEVPEHWEVERLKYLVSGIQMGPFGASLKELEGYDTGYKLFGQENTISGDFHKGRRWLLRSQFDLLRRYELNPGDLVLTRKGSIGKCKMVPSDAPRGIADSDTIRVRVKHERVLDRFVVLLLQEAAYVKGQIESVQRGAVVGGLNTATIGNLLIAVPRPGEQGEILRSIEAETGVVSDLLERVSDEIDLLREYRTRLIADVVTGKLDVRTVSLPEVLEEEVAEELDGSEDEAEGVAESEEVANG